MRAIAAALRERTAAAIGAAHTAHRLTQVEAHSICTGVGCSRARVAGGPQAIATALSHTRAEIRHAVYISGGQELRGAEFGTSYADGGTGGMDSDYELSSSTEIAYLFAHGVRLARVAYDNGAGMPAFSAAPAPQQHVLINLDDTLGSTALVIDQATGELVESTAYLAHGGTESDYRPERWKGLREDYRFTGKEEDVEVGLQYFGKRFLSPHLGRWVSADPLAVQSPGKGDPNHYAYASGEMLRAIDLEGLDAVILHGGGPGGA